MKKFLFSFLALLSTGFLFGQTVNIGTGTTSIFSTSTSATSAQSPWNPYYGYTYAQTIYLQSEINATGNITSIAYYFAGSTISNNADIKVWMKEDAKSGFTSNTDWIANNAMTLVYDGQFSGAVPGWVEITLQTPFAYTNTGNLVIAIDENTPGDNGTSGFRYSATAANSNRVIFYRSDGTNPDPSSPPTANGRSNQIGNIQINGLTLVGCQPPTSLDGVYNSPDANFDWQPPAGGSSVTQYNWEYRSSGAAGSGATGLISSGNTPNLSVTLTNAVNGTFYVRSDCGGTYSLWQSFALNIPPSNDDPCGAVLLTAGSTCSFTAGTLVNATGSTTTTGGAIPAPGCASYAGGDVWFKVGVPANGGLIFDSDTSNLIPGFIADGGMAIYSSSDNTCDGTFTLIECDDDDSDNGALSKIVKSGLNPGDTIFIRFWEYGNDNRGTFSICVQEIPDPPANDDCTNAVDLTVNPDLNCAVAATGTTLSATASAESAPSCSATGINDDVWYKFTAVQTAHKISVTGAASTTAIALYDGCGGNQIPGACASSALTVNGLTVGVEYYVRVYTTSATVGINSNFTICVGTPPPPPSNDEPCGAILLTTGPTCSSTNATVVNATASTATTGGAIPAPGCASYSGGDVWFKVGVPATGRLIFDSDTSNAFPGYIADGGMAIYSSSDNTCDGTFTLIECDDDDSDNGALSKIDKSGLNPGDTIFIRFWEYGNDNQGTFSICVIEPPAPPACVTIISPVDGAINIPSPVSLSWDAEPTATAYDVYLGTANTPTATIATNLATTSFTYNAAVLGQTYYWYVKPKNTGGSAIGCDATIYSFTTDNPPPPPANDDCSGATTLTPSATDVCSPTSGNTAGATASSETAPSCSATGVDDDVWYKFTATSTAHFVNISNANNATAFAVYSGVCGSLTQISGACVTTTSGSSSLKITGLTVAEEYTIRVYSTSATGVNSIFNICVTSVVPPANDDCAGAIAITNGATLNGNSNAASGSSPNITGGCATGTADDDMWYTFTTNGGDITITVVGGPTYDAVVQLIEGNCGSLTQVAGTTCPDGSASAGTETLTKTGLAPGTYFIRVWDYSSGLGDAFTITATGTALPVSLSQFNGVRVGGINKLTWTTKTEINNAGFELQRSADGRNFTKLGYVAAKSENGNSTRELNYSFNDTKPYAGVSYYRLNQVDKDGKSTLSNVVAIKGDKLNEVQFSAVYPNPAKDRLNVVLASPKAERVTLVVTDLSGKVIKQQMHNATEGNNNIEVNVNSLSAGTYIIKLVCASGCETAVQKFMKN